ncbi:efflux pump [Xylariomycetidae sp. FL0641]|nr:efflux pump [Xylariomycetidae sp. FL0641]
MDTDTTRNLGDVARANLANEGTGDEEKSGSSRGVSAATSTPESEKQDDLEGMKLFLVMFSLTLSVFLMLLDSSIVATVSHFPFRIVRGQHVEAHHPQAIPKITADFRSLNDIGWYGTAYLLANCAFQPLSGKIYTYFNVKWSFLVFFAIFELGSALCGAASSSTMLIVGRAVAGLGASGLLNGGYTMVALIVPTAKQPAYRGILMGLSFFGLLGGPLIGGALTEFTTWRWCFYINLPSGALIAAFLLLVTIPDRRVSGDGKEPLFGVLQRLDLLGFGLFTPAIIMFILALQWGGTRYPWDSATVIGLFAGAFVNLLVFLGWEYHVGAEAMIPLSLISQRVIWSSCLNMACFIGCSFTTAYYFPVYFQAVRDASPVQSGVGMLPQVIANMLTTIFTGALGTCCWLRISFSLPTLLADNAVVGRVGYYLPFALASGVLTSIGTGLVTTLTPHSSTGKRIGFQILQGFQGLGFQIPILAVQNSTRKEDVSIATALVVFAQNLSGALFLSLDEVIFSSRLRHFLSTYVPGVDSSLLINAGASAAGLRDAVPPELLPSVRLAYSDTFDQVMYLGTGAAVAAFLFATGMGWNRISDKTETRT